MVPRAIKIAMIAAALIFMCFGAAWAGGRNYHRVYKNNAYSTRHYQINHYNQRWNRHPYQVYRRYRYHSRPVPRSRHPYPYDRYSSYRSSYFIGGSVFEPGWSFSFTNQGTW
jgi:hypothetical protein